MRKPKPPSISLVGFTIFLTNGKSYFVEAASLSDALADVKDGKLAFYAKNNKLKTWKYDRKEKAWKKNLKT